MNIKSIGGEFVLIDQLTRDFKSHHKTLFKGVGDDCAVIDQGANYQLISTDSLVENDHFNLAWSTAEQIGMKAMEVNVSDIIACGGLPKFILVSLVLPRNIDPEIVQNIYKGIEKKCRKYQIDLIGGDTTHGTELVINITIIGEISKQNLRLRSHAKPEDLICVTGNLGGSAGGLEFLRKFQNTKKLQKEFPYLYQRHLKPLSCFNLFQKIVPYSNAMIDVSDGLASEVRHICEESKCGAEVNSAKIPLHPETKLCAEKLNQKAKEWALSGGEDFELVFTISPNNYKKFQAEQTEEVQKQITIVGKILPDPNKIILLENGVKKELRGGYDHFK